MGSSFSEKFHSWIAYVYAEQFEQRAKYDSEHVFSQYSSLILMIHACEFNEYYS